MRDRVVMRGGEVVKVMRVLPQKCKLKVPGDIVYLLICFWECFWVNHFFYVIHRPLTLRYSILTVA